MPDGPDIPSIVRALDAAGVRYVLTGSVAAAVHGVPVEPRDFDIAPDLAAGNLARLAGLLARWAAKPIHDPGWPDSLSPEECERWLPHPPTPGQLDHLLTTPLGLFDVVPWRSGWYLDLVCQALERDIEGIPVRVAHPDDLIATLKMDREKHQSRRPLLEEARRRIREGTS
jgi:hypothetical protein